MVKFNRRQRFQNIRQPSGDDIDYVRGGVINYSTVGSFKG